MPLMTKKPTTTGESKYKPHAEGQHIDVCVDVIDLGERVEKYDDGDKLMPKVAIVFTNGEKNGYGDYITVSREFVNVLGGKTALRQMLEAWRGKAFTPEELDAGFDLEKLIGVGATVTVTHQTSKAGRTYGKLVAVAPVHAKLRDEIPKVTDYERAPYWATRAAEYKQEADAFVAAHEASLPAKPTGAPTFAQHSDSFTDDLPF